MSGNPADISGTPIDISIIEIEDPFGGNVAIEVITTRSVDYSLGFACTAADAACNSVFRSRYSSTNRGFGYISA